MTDNVISFEEFRSKKLQAKSKDDPIIQVLKKALREQEDVVDWYLFHRSFNRYKEFSKSTLKSDKYAAARSIIKINDDAHFNKVAPLSDILFIDHTSFLEKAWENLGLYIEILPTHWV